MPRKKAETEEVVDTTNNLQDTLNAIKKKFGTNTIMRAAEIVDTSSIRIPSGIFLLDVGIGGGIPKGRTLIYKGEPSSGKTSASLMNIVEFQKRCRECNTLIEGGCSCGKNVPHRCAYIDVEGTFDTEWASAIGVNTTDLLLSQPEYGEQSVDILEALIRSGEIDLIVVDSLAAIVPMVEVENDAEKQTMGIHARLINKMCRAISSGLNSLGMTNDKKPSIILINQIREKLGVMWGCLHGETQIPLADGSCHTIRHIVENRIQGNVFSINEQTGEVEEKPITDWFYNGKVEEVSDYIHIETRMPETLNGFAGVTVTPNHLLYVQRNGVARWVEAQNVTIDDKLISKYDSVLSGTFAEFFAGTYVGDCSLEGTNRSSRICLQDSKNPAYVEWKADKLSAGYRIHNIKEYNKYLSPYTYELHLIKQECPNRSLEVLEKYNSPLALAIWYMDDGTFSKDNKHYRASISMKRFKDNEEEKERAVRIFNKYDIQVKINSTGMVRMDKVNTHKFFNLICTFVPTCMEYKLGEEYRGKYEDFNLTFTPTTKLIPVDILLIRNASQRQMRDKGKYDLGIKDNHNYFAGNYSNGVIVHNSPETMPGGKGQNFTSSITIHFTKKETLTEDKSKTGNPVGVRIEFYVEKNKTFVPFQRGSFELYQVTNDTLGIRKGSVNNPAQVVQYALNLGKVQQKGAWYFYPTVELPDIKATGLDNFIAEVLANPEIYSEIQKEIQTDIKARFRV